MVSNPPVEVGVNEDKGVGYLSLTDVGNSHVDLIGASGFALDAWALRQLAKQAEQAADALEATDE